MSKLESTITELERQLALKKGFQAVKFVLPKSTPDDVATEIQSKLREIAEGLALSKEQLAVDGTPTTGAFTADQVEALKMLADTVMKKTAPKGEQPAPMPTQSANPVPVQPQNNHVPRAGGSPRKGRIITAENVRGEGKRFAVPEDEVYLPSPEKVDDHGMISATHMKRGVTFKIPVDDVEFID